MLTDAREFSELSGFLRAGCDKDWREKARDLLTADPQRRERVAGELQDLLGDPRAIEAWVRLWAIANSDLPDGRMEPGVPILRSLGELRVILLTGGQ